MDKHKLSLSLHAAFALIALLILIDFASPGRIVNDEIISIKKERQQYYNAARNYHYSYKVLTNEHEFLVKEDFVELEPGNERIEYSVSRLFKEVNWYRLISIEDKSFYSLRIASGLVLPLLNMLSIFLVFRYKKKLGTIVFILQTLLLADLIFLIT